MRRFVKQLAWFLVGILCINLVLWIVSRKVLFADYRHAFSQLGESSHQAVLLGDSHVEALAQTNLDQRILNLGFASDSPPDMLVKLLCATDKHKDFEVVFLQADNHILNAYRLQLNNRKRVVEFSNFAAYQQSYGGSRIKYFWEKYVENYFPVVAVDRSPLFQRMVHGMLKRCMGLILRRGIAASPDPNNWSRLSSSERYDGAKERMEKHFTTDQNPELQNVFLRIVEIGRQRGVHIVGIKYPLTREYRDLADARFTGRSVAGILREQGVEVVDFSALYDGSPEFFKDADHLNTRGAQAFSLRLAALLERRFDPAMSAARF